jgi:hypothetical protein
MKKIKQPTGSLTQGRRGLSRRDFLADASLMVAGVAVGVPCAALDQAGGSDNRRDRALHGGKTSMTTRMLGKLEVSALGLGCMSISANYGPPAD